MEERQDFLIEEGLHQAVVFKLSHGAPDLKIMYLLYLAQLIIFSTMERNSNVEFFHGPLDIILRSKRPSAVGKPIAIDKATQIKSRPSTTRVKVILDLMEKLPNRTRLQFVDGKSVSTKVMMKIVVV
ncbi:hypothetical protein KY289_006091 [Solanum tuberosum]|nr:hypothetical protein KY289_006091 [Solanum tuberosum]